MNLILIDPEERDGDLVQLCDRRAQHIVEVIRAKPGDRLRIGIVQGPAGWARVKQVDRSQVTLSIDSLNTQATAPQTHLILAVPRPKVLKRIVRAAACLGVARVDLVNAWRVEKAYFNSPVLFPSSLEDALRMGCEQSATTWIPEIAVHRLLMPFLKNYAPQNTALIAHPGANTDIETVFESATQIFAITQ